MWTYHVSRPDDLPRAVATARAEGAPDDLTLGPFVDGVPVSVSFLVTARSAVALEPGHQEMQLAGEKYEYRGGRMPLASAEMRHRAVRLARLAVESVDGLQGFVGVDLILGHDGPRLATATDHVLEINPRLTTSYLGLRQIHRSWNIAEQWLRACLEERTSSLRLPREAPRDGVGPVRFAPGGDLQATRENR